MRVPQERPEGHQGARQSVSLVGGTPWRPERR